MESRVFGLVLTLVDTDRDAEGLYKDAPRLARPERRKRTCFVPSFLVAFSLKVGGGQGKPTAGLFVETWHVNWGPRTLQGVRAKTFATGDPFQQRGQSDGGKGFFFALPCLGCRVQRPEGPGPASWPFQKPKACGQAAETLSSFHTPRGLTRVHVGGLSDTLDGQFSMRKAA